MSEYTDKSSVTKLIGAPPGYVGHEQGGNLTEAVRTKPYSVIVFDHAERAQREVQGIIRQIMAAGVLNDNRGRRIDFKNTMIFLTTEPFAESDGGRISLPNDLVQAADSEYTLNAFDLPKLKELAELRLRQLAEELAAGHIRLEWEETLPGFLAERVYAQGMGAGLLNRMIEKEIITLLSMKSFAGGLTAFATVRLAKDEQGNITVES